MNHVTDTIRDLGILPVLTLERADKAVPLAQALTRGGLPAMEITLRTEAAADAIKNVRKALPDFLIGAGSVLTTGQAESAIEAGAQFLVSPGFNPEIIDFCLKKTVPIIPGVNNPTHVEQALGMGLDTVKFFPAEPSGGLAMLKALSGPYPGMHYIPMGSIRPNQLADYLSHDRVLACGAGWVVPQEALESGDFAAITASAEEAVKTVLGFELIHVGINQESGEEAKTTAAQFESLFSFTADENPGSIFLRSRSKSTIEVLKTHFLGEMGHLAIGTRDIRRAMAFLTKKGVGFRPETLNPVNGVLKTAYLDLEIGGFAVHLLQM